MSTPGFSADISLYMTRAQYRATSAWQRGAGVLPQASAGGCWPPVCAPGVVQRCCIRTSFGWNCWVHICPGDPCDFLPTAEERCHCHGGSLINGICVYHIVGQ
jgi:hypothetical protein